MSPRNHSVPLAEPQHHVIDPTNPRRALDDGVEHRLHVRGRAADDAEHLGCRRLMLQGFAQFRVALLEFFEQPHVLDRDHRLIGEGFEQSDLFFGERTNLVRRILITPIGTPSRSSGMASAVRIPVCLREPEIPGNPSSSSASKIVDMDRLPVENGSTSWRSAIDRSPTLAKQVGRSIHSAPLSKYVAFDAIESQRHLRRTTVRRSLRPHPALAEYPSASWR